MCAAINAESTSAAPITYNDEGDIRKSDTSVTPTDLSASGRDIHEPDNNRGEARLIRMDSAPQDHTLPTRDDEDWYQIKYSDGPGYIRIGATGPIRLEDFDEQGTPNLLSGSDPPGPGATLIEDVHILPHDLRKGRKSETLYIKIQSLSDDPIAYRLSVVSELPLHDIGAPTPEIAADEYLSSIASGNLRTLFEMTRSQITTDQATALRENLFGQTKPFQPDNGFGPWPGEGSKLKLVQRVIGGSLEAKQVYSFVVTCQKKNGLYLVVSARQDPSVSENEEAAFIKDHESNKRIFGGSSPVSSSVDQKRTAAKNRKNYTAELGALPTVPIAVGGVTLMAVAIALVRRKRKKLNQHTN